MSYNIFKALKVKNKELIHSAFIADLLRPKGKHGKGTAFFELFVEVLNEKWNMHINPQEEVRVKCEQVLKNNNNKELGRADIWIKQKTGDEAHYVIIENKIYAGDQNEQIKRYNEYLETREGKVIYLTPSGKVASRRSHRGTKYEKVGYATIIEWLELCIKECENDSDKSLYFTLLQYKEIVVEITKEYNEAQTQITGCEEDLSGVAKALLEQEFWVKLEDKFSEETDWTTTNIRGYDYDKISKGKEWYGLVVKCADSELKHRIAIAPNKDIYYGTGQWDNREKKWSWNDKEKEMYDKKLEIDAKGDQGYGKMRAQAEEVFNAFKEWSRKWGSQI